MQTQNPASDTGFNGGFLCSSGRLSGYVECVQNINRIALIPKTVGLYAIRLRWVANFEVRRMGRLYRYGEIMNLNQCGYV